MYILYQSNQAHPYVRKQNRYCFNCDRYDNGFDEFDEEDYVTFNVITEVK